MQWSFQNHQRSDKETDACHCKVRVQHYFRFVFTLQTASNKLYIGHGTEPQASLCAICLNVTDSWIMCSGSSLCVTHSFSALFKMCFEKRKRNAKEYFLQIAIVLQVIGYFGNKLYFECMEISTCKNQKLTTANTDIIQIRIVLTWFQEGYQLPVISHLHHWKSVVGA